jgi:hypothetical protein
MSQHFSTESQRFAHRLRLIMRAAGHPLSPTLVANEFNLRYWGEGITVHAARNWLNGISLPKSDKLRVLAMWLQVKPQDLLFGLDAKPAMMGVEERAEHSALTLADEYMLEKYRSLSHDYQRMVKELVSALHLLMQHDKLAGQPNVAPESGTTPTSPATQPE